MLAQSPEGEMNVIDFREVAPGASTQEMFGKDKMSSLTVDNISWHVIIMCKPQYYMNLLSPMFNL